MIVGYEATCFIEDHQEIQRCTRTRSYAPCGGPDMAERMLKWWAICGHADAESKGDHMSMDDDFEPPTLQQLDEWPMPVVKKCKEMPAHKRRRLDT